MNDEQSKRLADAADALISAADALDEARDAVGDRRFESEQERERLAAAQQMGSRLDNAGKRVEEALRKGAIAAAATGRPGVWLSFREAVAAAREARAMGKSSADADGSAAKRARGEEAWDRLDVALEAAAKLVYPE
jgi:hypothetical protein